MSISKNIVFLFVLLSFFPFSRLSAAGNGTAEYFNMKRFGDDYTRVTSSFVTAHSRFGEHNIWQDMRVLFLTPAWGTGEIRELVQRFNINSTVLMYNSVSSYSGTDAGWSVGTVFTMADQAKRFDRALNGKKYDLIVFANAAYGVLPDKYRMDILTRVYQDGCGLLLINAGSSSELNQLFAKNDAKMQDFFAEAQYFPFANKETWKHKITAVQFGKGRAVRIKTPSGRFHSLTFYHAADQKSLYDASLALIMKFMTFPAAKEKPLAMKRLDGNSLEADFPAETVSSGIRLFPVKGEKEIFLDEEKLSSDKKISIPLERIPNGDYLMLVYGKNSEGKVNSFSFLPLQVIHGDRIKSLKLDKRQYDGNEKTMSAKLATASSSPASCRAVFRITDANGRLIAKKELPVSEQMQISFPLPQPLTSGYFLFSASLFRDGNLVEQTALPFLVRGRRIPEFTLGSWAETDTGYLSCLIYKALAENGVDYLYWGTLQQTPSESGFAAASNNLMLMPAFPRYNVQVVKNSHPLQHKKPLTLRENRLEGVKMVRSHLAKIGPADILGFTDGSDVTRQKNSYDAASIAGFRAYLSRRYGTIENLNRKWKTSFSDFSAITPKQEDEKAGGGGCGAVWIEFNRYNAEAFLEYYVMLANASKEFYSKDGQSVLGPDGFGRLDPYDFADFYEVLRKLNYFNLYYYQDPPQIEICRSLLQYAPNVKYRTIYDGSYAYSSYTRMRFSPWHMLLHGYNGYFYFFGINNMRQGGQPGTILTPDRRPSEGFSVTAKEIAAIRKGIVQSINAAKRQCSGIGILYSYSSIAAAEYDGALPEYKRGLESCLALLEDCFLQYEFVPEQEVEKNSAILEKYKILILPQTRVLSPETDRAIRSFAQKGGLVIADLPPGKYDPYLNPGPADVYEKLFLEKNGSFALVPWQKYFLERKEESRRNLLGLTSGRTTDFLRPKGYGNVKLEKIEYLLPGNDILAAFINYDSKIRNAGFDFPEKHVYNIRKGTYAGPRSSLDIAAGDGETLLYLLADRPIRKESYACTAVYQPTSHKLVISLHADSDTPGCAFSWTVLDGRNRPRKEYGQALYLEKGKTAEAEIPLALNDPAGEWQITFRNEFTHDEYPIRVTVQGKEVL